MHLALREASVFPAAMETMVWLSVRCDFTSFSTEATNWGFTARKTTSLSSMTCQGPQQGKRSASRQDASQTGNTGNAMPRPW